MTDKQLKMQEAILLAVHPGLSIEEAILLESLEYGDFYKNDNGYWHNTSPEPVGIPLSEIPTHPNGLERTLVALGDDYIYRNGYISYYETHELLCKREPMKSLFQQDISTQDTIYSILCKDE